MSFLTKDIDEMYKEFKENGPSTIQPIEFKSLPLLRTCYVVQTLRKKKEEEKYKKAYFHKWITNAFEKDGKQFCNELALIEYTNGEIAQVKATNIRFADGGPQGAYVWKEIEDGSEDS